MKMTTNLGLNDFLVATFYFRLLSVKSRLKQSELQTFHSCWPLNMGKTIGKAISVRPKGDRGRLIEVAAK